MLVPEAEALSAELFATPPDPIGSLVPITRRMTVARTTPAPMLCFGLESMDGTPQFRSLASPAKKAAKSKAQQHNASTPAAPAELRGGAAGAAAAAPAAAGTQQQQPADQQATGGKEKKARNKKDKQVGTCCLWPASTPCTTWKFSCALLLQKKKLEQATDLGAAGAAVAGEGVRDQSSSRSKKRKAADHADAAGAGAALPVTLAAPASAAEGSKPAKEKKEKKVGVELCVCKLHRYFCSNEGDHVVALLQKKKGDAATPATAAGEGTASRKGKKKEKSAKKAKQGA